MGSQHHTLFLFMHLMPQTNLDDLLGPTHSSVPSLILFPLLGMPFPFASYIQILPFFKAAQIPFLSLLQALTPSTPAYIYIICFTCPRTRSPSAHSYLPFSLSRSLQFARCRRMAFLSPVWEAGWNIISALLRAPTPHTGGGQ